MLARALPRLLAAALCAVSLALLGARPTEPVPRPTPAPTAATPPRAMRGTDSPAAQQLAIDFVDDVLRDRWESAFGKMEARYRVTSSALGLQQGVGMMTDYYGKPLEFRFKTRVDGGWQYPDGEIKPLSKYWFKMPTPRHAEGVFAAVSVVPDGDHPAVAVFSILSFPNEPPDYLK